MEFLMEFSRFLQATTLVACSLLVSSCSSISQQECEIGDWYSIGVNDGRSGADSNKQYRKYQKECASHGIQADFKRYRQGYDQGLVFYCDFAHGEAHGRSGASFNTACTGPLEPKFRLGYERGIRWHQAKSEVDHLQFELDQRYRQIQQNRDLIYDNNQRLVREQNAEVRAQLLYRNDHLSTELNQLNTEVGRLQVQLYQAEQSFSRLEQQQSQQYRQP